MFVVKTIPAGYVFSRKWEIEPPSGVLAGSWRDDDHCCVLRPSEKSLSVSDAFDINLVNRGWHLYNETIVARDFGLIMLDSENDFD